MKRQQLMLHHLAFSLYFWISMHKTMPWMLIWSYCQYKFFGKFLHEIFWGQIHTHAEQNRRVGCGLLTLPRTSAILADCLMLLVIPNQPFLSKNNSLCYKDLASRAVFNIGKKHSKKIFKLVLDIFSVTRQLCWCQGKTNPTKKIIGCSGLQDVTEKRAYKT